MQRVLFLRPDKAGDALKSLPALRAIRALRPGDEFHILASKHNSSVFEYEPGFKVSLSPKGLPPFDKLINLLCEPADVTLKLFKEIAAPQKYSFEGSATYRDEVANISGVIERAFGTKLSLENAAPVLSSEDHKEAGEKMGIKSGRWLGICPIAGNSHRTHSQRRWKSFIKFITSRRSFDRYFLFGGPTDLSSLEQLRTHNVEIFLPSSFRTLGAYMKRLDGVVAIDSGPLHLARSLEVPTLGILNGGDFLRWFPGKGHLVKRGFLHGQPGLFQMLVGYGGWLHSL